MVSLALPPFAACSASASGQLNVGTLTVRPRMRCGRQNRFLMGTTPFALKCQHNGNVDTRMITHNTALVDADDRELIIVFYELVSLRQRTQQIPRGSYIHILSGLINIARLSLQLRLLLHLLEPFCQRLVDSIGSLELEPMPSVDLLHSEIRAQLLQGLQCECRRVHTVPLSASIEHREGKGNTVDRYAYHPSQLKRCV